MAGKLRQRGAGILMLLYVVGTLACGGLVAAQAFPTYTEYQAILKAVKRAAGESTIPAARLTYEKAASVDGVTSVQPKDLNIVKGPGDALIVSFAYNKEIHLFANAYLTIKYEGDSRQK